jgi:hypothetical protein
VVDASNDASKRAAQTLLEGTRRLLAAEKAVGVGHHVGVSIVGGERVPLAYFPVKASQERAHHRPARHSKTRPDRIRSQRRTEDEGNPEP